MVEIDYADEAPQALSPPHVIPDLTGDEEVIAFERRLFRSLSVTTLLVILAGVFVTKAFWPTLSAALGAGLGVLNFRWLRTSLKAVLTSGRVPAPMTSALKFVGRYLVIVLVVYGGYRYGRLNLAGICAGLLVVMLGPPIAETCYQLFSVIRGRGNH